MNGPIGASVVEDKRKPRRGGKGGNTKATAPTASSTEFSEATITSKKGGSNGNKKGSGNTPAAAGGKVSNTTAATQKKHVDPAAAKSSEANGVKKPKATPQQGGHQQPAHIPVELSSDPLTLWALGVKKGSNDAQQPATTSFKENVAITARGVMNSSNFCFMSAVLQALTHCPSFAHLVVNVAASEKALCTTYAEEIAEAGIMMPKGGSTAAVLGTWMGNYWKSSATPCSPPKLPFTMGNASALGRIQEDAQEFWGKLMETVDHDIKCLTAILQRMHLKQGKKEGGAPSGSGEKTNQKPQGKKGDVPAAANTAGGKWITVGKKNEKITVTQHSAETEVSAKAAVSSSATGQEGLVAPVRSIFQGKLHHHVKGAAGNAKNITSVNVEPFFVLPVDVASGNTIEEVLHAVATKESIQDDHNNTTIRKSTCVGELPPVLVIQLRRWAVTREGDVVKLDNSIGFGKDLTIPKDICESNSIEGVSPITSKMRKYRLLSVVCHRGETMGSGHYVTYLADEAIKAPQARGGAAQLAAGGANNGGGGGTPMLLCNDSRVTQSTLAKAQADCPYFLIYQRL